MSEIEQAQRITECIRDQHEALVAGGGNAGAVADRIRLGDVYPLIAAQAAALDTALDIVEQLGGDRVALLDDILELVAGFVAQAGGTHE